MARLSFQTHIWLAKHTFGFSKHTFGFSKHTFGFSKHTFGFSKHTFGFSKHTFGFSKHTFGFQNTHLAFQNTHLAFKTHIWLFKNTHLAFKTHIWLLKTHICFKEQSPREVQKKTKCKEVQHGDLFHFDVVVLLHRSDAREAKTGIRLLSKAFVLLAVKPTAGGQGLEKQAAAVQLCFFFRRGEGRPAGLDTRGRGRTWCKWQRSYQSTPEAGGEAKKKVAKVDIRREDVRHARFRHNGVHFEKGGDVPEGSHESTTLQTRPDLEEGQHLCSSVESRPRLPLQSSLVQLQIRIIQVHDTSLRGVL